MTTWYRAVADEPIRGDKHISGRFLSRAQARADASRIRDKYGVQAKAVECPVPDDPTELFEL